MRFERIVLSCSSLLSCVDAVRIDPPPVEGAASALLVVSARGDIDVFAQDASPGTGTLEFPAFAHPLGSTFRLFVIAYDQTLDRLELQPGRVPLGGDRPLPKFSRAFALDGAEESSSWQQVDSLPAEVRDIRLAGSSEDLCMRFATHFSARALPLPATSDAPGASLRFGIAIDASTVFIGTLAGEFFLVTTAATERLTHLPPSTPHLAAFRSQDGEIWLVGSGGATAHGRDPRAGFTPGPRMTSTNAGTRMWLTGADTPPLELFAITDDAVLEHFDGEAWAIIDIDAENKSPKGRRGVTWIGPGEAMAVGPDLLRVVHRRRVSNEDRFEVVLERAIAFPEQIAAEVEFLSTVKLVPSLGVIAATSFGRVLLRNENGSWSEIAGSPFLNRRFDSLIKSIAPHETGFLVGGQPGDIAQYHPVAGFCDNLQGIAQNDVNDFVPLEDGYLLVNDFATDDRPTIVLLTP